MTASLSDRIPTGCAPFGIGAWDHLVLGNHRAVIRVDAASDAVCAYLPWRRRDRHPESKHVLVVSEKTGAPVGNSMAVSCNREYGEVVFEPIDGPGIYYAYYFVPTPDPHAHTWPRWAFPITRYMAPRPPQSAEWAARQGLTPDAIGAIPPSTVNWDGMPPEADAAIPRLRADAVVYAAPWRSLPQAEQVEFQARSEWDSFFPMEIIATVNERLSLERRGRHRSFILVPENRCRPIRMTDAIPYVWTTRTDSELQQLADEACRNEYYVFQIGVVAHRETLADLTATCSELVATNGARIPASNVTCFNLEGTDQFGKPFTTRLHVSVTTVQALWFGVDIPADASPSTYRGVVSIAATGLPAQTVEIVLTVSPTTLADRGDGDHWRLSRLRWLNSNRAHDTETYDVYSPVAVNGRTIDVLGRRIVLGDNGQPTSLASFIDMFEIKPAGREILAAPITLTATVGGKQIPLPLGGCRLQSCVPGKAVFESAGEMSGTALQLVTTIEVDGAIEMRLCLRTKTKLLLEDLRLSIRIPDAVARLFTTSNDIPDRSKAQGGTCPDNYSCPIGDFQQYWVGDYNAGLGLRLPEGNNFWTRGQEGFFRLLRHDGARELVLSLGKLVLEAGESADYIHELYVTPFKPLPKAHWDWRYYHAQYMTGLKADILTEVGARIGTQHHETPLNPYINYPLLTADRLLALGEEVHSRGGLFKFYYTIRELSVRASELWTLRSLGDEILVPSVGRLGYEELSELPLEYQLRNPYHEPFTGMPWLCEHLVHDHHSRWHSKNKSVDLADGSLQANGASRWSNFFIESLIWLMRNAALDGLYFDGVTFDRTSLRRIRKTLLREKPQGLIDWHGGPSSIHLLPFCDSIWNGEGALSEREPDYWLAVMSGIAFGTLGELLVPESSVARGMVYGLSQRYGWMALDQVDPSGLWRWWDAFDIKNATMLGYWQEGCPVRTGHPLVKATAYVHHGRRMAIALASWAPEPVTVSLTIDWDAVGIARDKAVVRIPEIRMFQSAAEHSLNAVPVAPDKGWIIEIEG